MVSIFFYVIGVCKWFLGASKGFTGKSGCKVGVKTFGSIESHGSGLRDKGSQGSFGFGFRNEGFQCFWDES